MKIGRFVMVALVVALLGIVGATTASAKPGVGNPGGPAGPLHPGPPHPPGPHGTVCSGGTAGAPSVIAPGVYDSLQVAGVCAIPDGTVTVVHDLVIAPNAALNAVSDATVTVWGNLNVGNNAIIGLGCNTVSVGSPPNGPCDITTNDFVRGDVRADQPLSMIFHSDTIGGNLVVNGGGGGTSCAPNPILSTWVFPGAPPYSSFEDGNVGGTATIANMQTCWLGFFREATQGNVAFSRNTSGDPDGNEVATNVVGGNLDCQANNPAAQVGDSGGLPNTVVGHKTGQCASL